MIEWRRPRQSNRTLLAESHSNTPANDAGAENPPQQEELPTPDELISDAIKKLGKSKGTDTVLLDILADYILTTKPAGTAVQDAANAIESLAAKRAKGSDDEQADHD